MKYIALAACLMASPTFAGEIDGDFVAATYTAYIGMNDLTNSSGARLGDAASVIRQDRANFHRFGTGHASDESDPLFADSGARAAMPAMISAAGGINSNVARLIMQGNIQVYVDIMSDGDDFTGLVVYTLN